MDIVKEKNCVYILNETNDKIAYMEFPLVSDGVVNLNHTYVSDSLRGQGIAGKLMTAAIEVIKENNYQVIASCSYAREYFSTHDTNVEIIG